MPKRASRRDSWFDVKGKVTPGRAQQIKKVPDGTGCVMLDEDMTSGGRRGIPRSLKMRTTSVV